MDKDYRIIFSELSKKNLSDILTYISVSLHSPGAAVNVLNCLQKEINVKRAFLFYLSFMPEEIRKMLLPKVSIN